MPVYIFLCRDCRKEFTKILRMKELEQGGITCPHCKSSNVAQQAASFSAVTSKKS